MKIMRKSRPKPMIRQNYLSAAKASVEANTFRKLYYFVRGKKIEVLRDGDLSCAFFVSAILKIFNLIDAYHTTVVETVKDMKRHGWRRIGKPRAGAVVVWKSKMFKSSGEAHKHVGIYLGAGRAVSNSSRRRSPRIHRWNYRPIEEILWNAALK